MEEYSNHIPPWRKYSLNISEAAEYYGIGEKRLRQIAYEHQGEDFVLEIGSHIRFKRKRFEEFLDSINGI
ncbi:MAG: helix-turn-helix domain-containing protein [Acetatifactor sp.]|nr:helix-turn-helix domain-containing protein [Acetatifactor sp.]